MSKFVVCLTTVGKESTAKKIAIFLVRKKLVACVNILPKATSVYSWKGKVCQDREWVLLMKTTQKRVQVLEKQLLQIHPYELPEFVVLPVIGGSQKYLKWVEVVTKESNSLP